MAITAAGGYTQLSGGVWSPSIFSQKALKALRRESVVEGITNTDYFGEISNFGDTVRIIREPDVVISSYTRGKVIVPVALADVEFTVTVDQANEFSFLVEDTEKAQSHINWSDLASNRAAYNLKDAYDRHVLNYMATSGLAANYQLGSTKAGSTETVAAIQVAHGVTPSATAFSPLNLMARVSRLMDQANVPSDNRWAVADPIFFEELSDEDSKLIPVYVTGESKTPLYNGLQTNGMLRGFKMYKSNNLPVAGTGPASAAGGAINYGTLLFGHMSGVATVSQIAKTETFRSPTQFADVTRGLHVFGRGVIRPETLFTVRYATGV